VAFVALAVVLPPAAPALSGPLARVSGIYVEGAGGVNWLDDSTGFYTLRPDHPIPALQNREFPSTTDYETGLGISGRLGYAMASGLRVDAEIAYRENDVKGSTFLATNGVNDFTARDDGATGHARSIALMANAYYDFLNSSGITPYVGGGIGAANVGGKYTSSFEPITQHANTIDDSDWGFAAQAIGGVSVALSSSLSLVADYRYLKVFDISTFQAQPTTPANPLFAAANIGGRGDYENHTVMVGLRYSFDSPSPRVPLK